MTKPRQVIFALYLVVTALLASRAFARERSSLECMDRLQKVYTMRYVSLDKEDLDDDLKEAVRAARKKVKDRLGWLPTLRRSLREGNGQLSDLKFFVPGDVKSRENAIASSSYKVDGKTLEMSLTEVKEGYRRNGLSELLLAEILAYHPWIKKIKIGFLTGTNADFFFEAYEEQDMGLRASFRTTPAYARYAALGFSKIIDAEIEYPEYRKVEIGGKTYLMETESGVLTFTVKRPKRKTDD